MRIILFGLFIIFAGCNDVETVTYDNKSDTSANSINKSEIISDSARLPRDSTKTGVQH